MKHATKNKCAALARYISLEELETPPVSRLYSLPPIGLGTGLVESLTSYTARLAQAHRVIPAQLFTREILPVRNQLPAELRIGASSAFGGYNQYFNGCTKAADFLTTALARLTLRSDLVSLSMLRWRGAIAGLSLNRRTLAWCGQCFSDWRQQGKALFEPLLWTIDLVTVCATHHSPLASECPTCHKRSAPLEARLRPGYCAKCGAWLGQTRTRVTKRSFSSFGLPAEFVSNQLFAALEADEAPVDQLTLAKRIKPMLNQRGWSNIGLMRAAGIHLGEFFSLRYARHGAPLKVLLKICHTTGIDLKDLLRKDALDLSILPVRKLVPEIGKWKNDTYVAALRSALETALAEPCPTALYRIAARFQCAPRQLPQNFPQLCHQITLKRKRFRARRRQRLINRLASALDAPEPQSSRALAKSLGVSYSGLYKAFPQEAVQLSARYRAFQKQSSMARKDAAAALIRGAAYRLHEQGTYPSVRKVLRELDWQRTKKTDELVREVMTSFRRELDNHSKAIVKILDS